jgi:hypothetical protein
MTGVGNIVHRQPSAQETSMSNQLSSLNLRKDLLSAMLCDPFLTIKKADELYDELYDVCNRIDHMKLTPAELSAKSLADYNNVPY